MKEGQNFLPAHIFDLWKIAMRYCLSVSTAKPIDATPSDLTVVLAGMCGEAALVRAGLFNGYDHNMASTMPILSRKERAAHYNYLVGDATSLLDARETTSPLGILATQLSRFGYPLEAGPNIPELIERLEWNCVGAFGFAPIDVSEALQPSVSPFAANLDTRDARMAAIEKALPTIKDACAFEICAFSLSYHLVTTQEMTEKEQEAIGATFPSLSPKDALEIACTTFLATARAAPLLDKHFRPNMVPATPRLLDRHVQ